MKLLGFAMIMAASASFAFASAVPVPEIDANSAVSVVALIGGGMLILRGRRKR